MSGGNFLDLPDSYRDLVGLSAKVLIMPANVMRHVTEVKCWLLLGMLHNAVPQRQKHSGVAFAHFAKDMTLWFCPSVGLC